MMISVKQVEQVRQYLLDDVKLVVAGPSPESCAELKNIHNLPPSRVVFLACLVDIGNGDYILLPRDQYEYYLKQEDRIIGDIIEQSRNP